MCGRPIRDKPAAHHSPKAHGKPILAYGQPDVLDESAHAAIVGRPRPSWTRATPLQCTAVVAKSVVLAPRAPPCMAGNCFDLTPPGILPFAVFGTPWTFTVGRPADASSEVGFLRTPRELGGRR
jgi:hypothetical protein